MDEWLAIGCGFMLIVTLKQMHSMAWIEIKSTSFYK